MEKPVPIIEEKTNDPLSESSESEGNAFDLYKGLEIPDDEEKDFG